MNDIEITAESTTLPQRSRLAQLTPLGVGTGAVESLWSFVFRLSAAHGRTMFGLIRILYAEALLTGRMRIETLRREAYDRICSESLHRPNSSRQFIAEAGQLLPVSAAVLEGLSLSRVAEILNHVTGLRKKRAWCAACYAGDPIPFDRLAWSFSAVECCGQHKVKLATKCPACGAAQRLTGTGGSLADCETCGKPLALPVEAAVETDAFALHVANTASELLSLGQRNCITTSAVDRFYQNLGALAIAAGSDSALAQRFCIAKSTMSVARARRSLPSLTFLAKSTWLGQVKVDAFVTQHLVFRELAPSAWSRTSAVKRSKKAVDSDAVLLGLIDLMRKNPYATITVSQLSRFVGVSKKHPSFLFPPVRELMAIQRRRVVLTRHAISTWTYCQSLRAAIARIETAGISLNSGRLNREVDEPGMFQSELARRIRDGYLRAVRSSRYGVLKEREFPSYLRMAAKWIN